MGNVEMRGMRGKEVREALIAFRGMVRVACGMIGPPLIVMAAVFVDTIKETPGLEPLVRKLLDGEDFDDVFEGHVTRIPDGAVGGPKAEA